MIKNAFSAAPPDIAVAAKVMGNLPREESGRYTCFPYEGGLTPAMCGDAEWMAWSDAYMMQKKDCKPSHFGLAYMLAGDPPSDASSNIDPFTTVAAADNQWVTEGPHVMIVGRDPAMLEGISAAPNSGGPSVMWKGTPSAHIMMPTGLRPN